MGTHGNLHEPLPLGRLIVALLASADPCCGKLLSLPLPAQRQYVPDNWEPPARRRTPAT